jgi:hypothetical protein
VATAQDGGDPRPQFVVAERLVREDPALVLRPGNDANGEDSCTPYSAEIAQAMRPAMSPRKGKGLGRAGAVHLGAEGGQMGCRQEEHRGEARMISPFGVRGPFFMTITLGATATSVIGPEG